MTTAELETKVKTLQDQIESKTKAVLQDDADSQAKGQEILSLLTELHAAQEALVTAKYNDLLVDLTKRNTDASQGTSAR